MKTDDANIFFNLAQQAATCGDFSELEHWVDFLVSVARREALEEAEKAICMLSVRSDKMWADEWVEKGTAALAALRGRG